MKEPNENSAADAFSKILSHVRGKTYSLVSSPDETNRTSSDVDFIYAAKSGRIKKVAAEHTIVESHEQQIRYVTQSFDIVKEIDVHCKGSIPSEFYYFLAIPCDLTMSFTKRSKDSFVACVSPIVAKKCADLKKINDSTKIPFDNYQLTLICKGSSPDMNGKVHRIPQEPSDSKNRVRQRLERSISSKLPKLRRYKTNGYFTALLLEDISGSVSNIGFYGSSLKLLHRLLIRLFVDYVVVFASYNQQMIVGSVWKDRYHWYKEVPKEKVFSFTYNSSMNKV